MNEVTMLGLGIIVAAGLAAHPPPPTPPATRAELLHEILEQLSQEDYDERYMDSYCWYEDGYTVCVWYNNGGGCVEVCGYGYCDVGCW